MRKKLQTAFIPRQYMLSRDFEIYYYSDSHLSQVNNHSHDYYEFYFFLEGNLTMYVDGQPVSLKTGDVLLIPPGVLHHAVNHSPDAPYRRFVFWVSCPYIQNLNQVSSAYTYITGRALQEKKFFLHYDRIDFNALQGKLFRLIEEIHSQRFGKEAMVTLNVNDLLLSLNRTAFAREHPESPPKKQHLYESLLQYIDSHLEEDLTLDYLAGYFYVSKYYISHMFKETMGLSIHQYITKKRLAMCRDAILSNAGINRVYLLYGFQDYSSFFRAFRKEYGLSPREYRKLYLPSALEDGRQTD